MKHLSEKLGFQRGNSFSCLHGSELEGSTICHLFQARSRRCGYAAFTQLLDRVCGGTPGLPSKSPPSMCVSQPLLTNYPNPVTKVTVGGQMRGCSWKTAGTQVQSFSEDVKTSVLFWKVGERLSSRNNTEPGTAMWGQSGPEGSTRHVLLRGQLLE